MKILRQCITGMLVLVPGLLQGQALYRMQGHAETRWASFENPAAAKGAGGRENATGKGHAWEVIAPGETKPLLEARGAGIIRRIWMTVSDRSPAMLRSLRIDMYWDGAPVPAVSAPLGDFFGDGLGVMVPFENALFADPEGRSFVCYAPMPFRSHARVAITNESGEPVTLFYDIDYLRMKRLPRGSLYFHAYWSSNAATRPGQDFDVLPPVRGKGRFLGASFAIVTDSAYRKTWWGEGEMKVYLDGDSTYPTLAGTGTEDYLGSGWGLDAFAGRYQGCPVADADHGKWSFYRYHLPDPVFFRHTIRVAIQQMGGGARDEVRALKAAGAALIPVSVTAPDYSRQWNLLDMKSPPALEDPDFPLSWVNFYRKDDYSATAYFYLNKPVSGLPPLASLSARLRHSQTTGNAP